jgi:hypothetical protein
VVVPFIVGSLRALGRCAGRATGGVLAIDMREAAVGVVGPGRRGWVFIAVAVALASASAVLARLWPPGALASGVGAGLSVVAGVWSARGAAVLQSQDSQRVVGGEVWRVQLTGRLQLVCDLEDPVALGVHPAAALGGPCRDRFTPFVARGISAELGNVLRRDRFVLLVGESTAGKSRAAYEVMRDELPGYQVVQPVRRDAVLVAAASAAATPRTVLWLDDLERFLGSGGLTGAAVREVLDARGGARYIVATMRSEEYAKFSGGTAFPAGGIGRDALRQGWDVLRLASRVDVPRMWSAEEIARARQMSQDPRLAEAVRHSGEYGVAEYLAAAPQLLAAWRDAWAPSTHPRAAAMVWAAVDARRAGVHRPLPLGTLLQLHEPYLRRRGGERLRPESPEAAVAWATTPMYATSSLLIPGEGGFLAFDYLIDAIDQDRVPAEAMDELIAFATSGEALDIGQLAWGWSLISQADTAFRRAEAGGLFEATRRRCGLISQDRGGEAAALLFAQEAAEWTTAVVGPDHPQALEASSLVAWQTGLNGDAAAALRLFERLASHTERVLSAGHEITLDMRAGAAAMTGYLGDGAAASGLYGKLAGDCSRALGEDHKTTTMCRDQAAVWIAHAGNPVQAVRMFRALLRDMTERFHSSGDDIFHTRYALASCLTQAGEYAQALREWEHIVADANATYGRLRSNSFYVREQHAWCVGESGDPVRAVQLLESLLADAVGLGDPELIQLLFARRALAWWVGEAGNPAEAERRLAALVDQASAQRGADDPRVRTLRLMLAHWTALNGPPEAALDALQRNLTQMTKDLGPGHEVTRSARRQLARRNKA